MSKLSQEIKKNDYQIQQIKEVTKNARALNHSEILSPFGFISQVETLKRLEGANQLFNKLNKKFG